MFNSYSLVDGLPFRFLEQGNRSLERLCYIRILPLWKSKCFQFGTLGIWMVKQPPERRRFPQGLLRDSCALLVRNYLMQRICIITVDLNIQLGLLLVAIN
ncbi:unnamed protein product [Phyllotreta striolata]|uniref:Uncharacterized protein n=1 Tax=Phyllotreta striolata TaxID=444603 RepID=A0A9N9XKH2_PHYSR|nr:unnamed protein product [Phyllotreta striolata]